MLYPMLLILSHMNPMWIAYIHYPITVLTTATIAIDIALRHLTKCQCPILKKLYLFNTYNTDNDKDWTESEHRTAAQRCGGYTALSRAQFENVRHVA